MTLKDYNSIIVVCNEAIAANPRYAEAYVYRGSAYFQKKLLDSAIADYTTAITINPQLGHAYTGRCMVYAIKGDYSLALADSNQAIQLNPQNTMAYSIKAFACDQLNLIEEAVGAYRNFIRCASANPKSFNGAEAAIAFAKRRIVELGYELESEE